MNRIKNIASHTTSRVIYKSLKQTQINTTKEKNGMSNHPKPDQKLDSALTLAMKKVGAKKENDVCRYIPGIKGGYIHHFSLRKMKHEDPEQFLQTINKYILNPNNPSKLPPKQRAPRGSRKRKDHLPLTKQDIDLLLCLARQSGQKEIIRKLLPRQELRTIKRELIASIKHNHIKEELWQSFVETVSAQTNSSTTHSPSKILAHA